MFYGHYFFIPFGLIFFVILGLFGWFTEEIETISIVLRVLNVVADLIVLRLFTLPPQIHAASQRLYRQYALCRSTGV